MEKTLNVVIARNEESFSFLYQETIDAFGKVTFFDPEKEVPDLDDADLLYLPGGYPERHLEKSSDYSTGNQGVCRAWRTSHRGVWWHDVSL